MTRVNTVGKPNFFLRSFLVYKLSWTYEIDVGDSEKKIRKILELFFQPFLEVFNFILNFSTRPQSPPNRRPIFSDREFNSASNETTLNLGNDGEKKFLCFSGQLLRILKFPQKSLTETKVIKKWSPPYWPYTLLCSRR